ncbi:MAG: RIO1 family regulatory kinase/ATPase [Holosporales bacterium]
MSASIVNCFRFSAVCIAFCYAITVWATPVQLKIPEFQAAVAQALGHKKRIQSFDVDGETFWLKRHSWNKASWWACVKRVLFAPLPRIVKPTLYCSRHEAVVAEVARMQQLRQQNIVVPEVVHVADDYFVMRDLGKPLLKTVKRHKAVPERSRLLRLAAQELAHLHRQGAIHGRGSLRDMVIHKQRIGFIDFEEPLPERADLTLFQARDLLLFLASVLPRFKKDPAAAVEVLRAYAEAAPPEVLERLDQLLFPWQAWIMRLDPILSPLGRDLREILNALRFYMDFRAS